MHSVCCGSLLFWKRSPLEKGSLHDLFLPRHGSNICRIGQPRSTMHSKGWHCHLIFKIIARLIDQSNHWKLTWSKMICIATLRRTTERGCQPWTSHGRDGRQIWSTCWHSGTTSNTDPEPGRSSQWTTSGDTRPATSAGSTEPSDFTTTASTQHHSSFW